MTTRYRQSWHLNEFTLVHVVRYRDPLNKKRFAVPFKTKEKAQAKMDQLKRDGVKEIEITQDTLRGNVKFKEGKEGDAYAIGMAQAKKSMNDEPPLEKKTIEKGHEIAKAILKKEDVAINMLEAMSPDQIKKLKDSWAQIKLMSPEKVKTLKNFLDKYSTDTLMQLAQSGINFVSNMARSVAMKRKTGDMKHAGSMKEELGKEDEPKVQKIIGKLKKASDAHAGQAKDLQKAMTEDDMGKFHKMQKDGKSAEQIAKALDIDVKSTKKLMDSVRPDDKGEIINKKKHDGYGDPKKGEVKPVDPEPKISQIIKGEKETTRANGHMTKKKFSEMRMKLGQKGKTETGKDAPIIDTEPKAEKI